MHAEIPGIPTGMILSPEPKKRFQMKTKHTAAVLFALLCIFSCRDDDSTFASIVGNWRGTLAEFRIMPGGFAIPVSRHDENFSSLIEFKPDGTLTLTEGVETRDGTYNVAGNTITTDLDLTIEGVAIPGTYTIEDLTETNLVFHVGKNGTFTDPDSGRSLSGDIKVTLHFQRI